MTSFTDREHAIEAHHALLELGAFEDRSHRFKELGFRLAARLGMHGSDAERFMAGLAELSIVEPADDELRRYLAAELARQGLSVSPAEIRRLVLPDGPSEQSALPASPPGRSWVEFVMTQLLLLFGAESFGPDFEGRSSSPARPLRAD
jgi:hypothetical protein